MKKLILMMISVLAFVSCASTKNAQNEAKSENARISMIGNPTTGFSWEYSQNPDGIVSVQENQTYLGEGEIAGAPSRFDYVLSAEKDGETTLTFVYRRSWEKDEPLEKSSYKVEVKNNKILIKSDFAGKWTLSSFLKDNSEQQIFDVQMTLEQKDGKTYFMGGKAGVNVFNGDIEIDGNKGVPSDKLALTKMLGSPEEMEFERLYTSMFEGNLLMETFVRNGTKILSIENPEKNLWAEYKAEAN